MVAIENKFKILKEKVAQTKKAMEETSGHLMKNRMIVRAQEDRLIGLEWYLKRLQEEVEELQNGQHIQTQTPNQD